MSTEKLRQNQIERELEEISEKIKQSRLKIEDIIIPLSVTLALILLTFLLFIPMIKSTIEARTEIVEIKREEQLKIRGKVEKIR